MTRWLLAAALLLALAAPAAAFEYADCGARACEWQGYPIAVYIDRPLDIDVADADAVAALRASLDRWDADHQTFCGPLAFNYAGRIDAAKPNRQDGKNIISFERGAWIYGGDALAITTLYFDTQGYLRETDLAFNAVSYSWSLESTDRAAGRYEIRATATHEAGHMWGLDHSDIDAATMYPYYKTGTVAEDLDEDDILGAATRFCDELPPPDDTDEQNDSFAYFVSLDDGAPASPSRLYDDDWFRVTLGAGLRLKVTVADESVTRYKRLELYDLTGALIDTQRCDGDCAQALGQPGEERRVALRITGDFDNHPIETAAYDFDLEQVAPGNEGDLYDDDAGDDDDDSGGRACGCQIGGAGTADVGWLAMALAVSAALARRRR